jgi:hypothetical protein
LVHVAISIVNLFLHSRNCLVAMLLVLEHYQASLAFLLHQ